MARSSRAPSPRAATWCSAHTGPYDQLTGTNAALQDYAKRRGIPFAARDTPAGQAWDGRFEHYLTDPAAEPDAARWQTEVAYLLADRD
jgi:hypothetical protein